MLTRTQWEVACFAGLISLAGIASTIAYNYGTDSSQSNVSSLERAIDSYKKSSKLDTEEFLTEATKAVKKLNLSLDERDLLRKQDDKISSLLETVQNKQTDLDKLQIDLSKSIKQRKIQYKEHETKLVAIRESHETEIVGKDQEIDQLFKKLSRLTAKKVEFTLFPGEGKTLQGESIQVGFINIYNYSNQCNVSINNKISVMSAGEYRDISECKVVLTSCTYRHGEDLPAKFELLCP